MSGLVEFLTARLDEDAAEIAKHPDGEDDWEFVATAEYGYPCEPYLKVGKKRALAEVEAKRQIVHAHGRGHECIGLTGKGDRSAADGEPWELWEPANTQDHGPCLVLRCLALPYADHPGYRPEWRPDTDPE